MTCEIHHDHDHEVTATKVTHIIQTSDILGLTIDNCTLKTLEKWVFNNMTDYPHLSLQSSQDPPQSEAI